MSRYRLIPTLILTLCVSARAGEVLHGLKIANQQVNNALRLLTWQERTKDLSAKTEAA